MVESKEGNGSFSRRNFMKGAIAAAAAMGAGAAFTGCAPAGTSIKASE